MTYYSEPSQVTGYALDAEDSFWEVCVPQATRNLVLNPSFESDFTANVGTVIRTDAFLGISCVQSVSSSSLQRVRVAFKTEVDGTHTVSCYVKWPSSSSTRNVQIRLLTSNATEVQKANKVLNTANKWVRLVMTTPSLSATTDYLIEVNSTNNTTVFVADCFQAEALPYATTYVDGDMGIYIEQASNSYYWDGFANGSVSVRLGNTRTGGRLVSLQDVGFRTLSISGLGHAPVERNVVRNVSGKNTVESFLLGQREITVSGNLFGKTFEELNRNKRQLMDLFSPLKLGEIDDPILVRIHLSEIDDPLDLLVRYSDGLQDEINNRHQQTIQLRFSAIENPYLSGNYNNATFPLLAYRNNTQAFLKNINTGEWSPLNYQTTAKTARGTIKDLYLDPSGDVYACGNMEGLVHKLKVTAEGENFYQNALWEGFDDSFTTSNSIVGDDSSNGENIVIGSVGLKYSKAGDTTLQALISETSIGILKAQLLSTATTFTVSVGTLTIGQIVYFRDAVNATIFEFVRIISAPTVSGANFIYTIERQVNGNSAYTWSANTTFYSNIVSLTLSNNVFVKNDIVWMSKVVGSATYVEYFYLTGNGVSSGANYVYTNVIRNYFWTGYASFSTSTAVYNGNGASCMDVSYIRTTTNRMIIAVAGKMRVTRIINMVTTEINCSVAFFDSSLTSGAWTALLNSSGTDPFANATINDVALYRGILYIAGKFSVSINGVTYNGIAAYDILSAAWVRPFQIGSNTSTNQIYSLYVHNDQRLYFGGVWSSSFTGNSNRLAYYDLNTGAVVSVLPSLVDPASGGPLYPDEIYKMMYDQNGKFYYLSKDGFSNVQLLWAAGKDAPSVSLGGISETNYSEWSYNYLALQGTTGQNIQTTSMAIDRNNGLYLSGPINYFDGIANADYPAFNNRILTRVWNRAGAISTSPLDAYHQTISLASVEFYPMDSNQKSIAVATNMENSPVYYTVPLQVNNTGSAPVEAFLQISDRTRFVSFWNWTTKQQIVLDSPLTLASQQRIVIFKKDNQFWYRFVNDTTQWSNAKNMQNMILPVNPSGTTSDALVLIPGINYLTLFYQRFSTATPDPARIAPRITWRNQHGYM